MFFPNSRYANAPTYTVRTSSGRTVSVARLPIRPRPAIRGFHLRNDTQRADLIAAHYLGDATAWYSIRSSRSDHTGKQGARDGVLDMYASRGGSALADGARMVAVLRTWEDEEKDKLTPPPGLSVGSDEQVIVLARPKVSYAPPQQPHIWITRRGYEFKHFLATKPDPEAEARARVDQLELYLIEKFKAGYRFTQNTLEVPLRRRAQAPRSQGGGEGRALFAEVFGNG